MGLFSSKKTTQTTQNVYETTNQNLQAQGPAILGTGNTLVYTDLGAIEAAERISRDAVSANLDAVKLAFQNAQQSTSEAMVFSEQSTRAALSYAESASRADTTVLTESIFRYGSIAAAVIAGVYLWSKAK